jgi:hypothetical protein
MAAQGGGKLGGGSLDLGDHGLDLGELGDGRCFYCYRRRCSWCSGFAVQLEEPHDGYSNNHSKCHHDVTTAAKAAVVTKRHDKAIDGVSVLETNIN